MLFNMTDFSSHAASESGKYSSWLSERGSSCSGGEGVPVVPAQHCEWDGCDGKVCLCRHAYSVNESST